MLQVLSGVAQVTVALPGPGGVTLYAQKRAGERTPRVVAEAYDHAGLVVAGELSVLDVNQALTSLRIKGEQGRRLALRDDGRGHGGYLDLVTGGGDATLVATGPGDRRAEFTTTATALAESVGSVLRHYLALTRSGPPPTIVLPDAQPSARAALIRPVP
ncbi:MAG TPA: hypothetical protein VFQ85_15440 [Mycobacteriales bacterium]|nr:hypothetical protein [Mycobacteriales bacterium]